MGVKWNQRPGDEPSLTHEHPTKITFSNAQKDQFANGLFLRLLA